MNQEFVSFPHSTTPGHTTLHFISTVAKLLLQNVDANMHFQIPSAALLLLLGSSSSASAACEGPAVNQATLDLVKEFEGWYPDICTWNLTGDSSEGRRQANCMTR